MKLLSKMTVPLIAVLMAACNNNAPKQATSEDSAGIAKQFTVTEQAVTVQADTASLQCLVAYNDDTVKKPVVLILPEWWGMNDYVKRRARQLAELGYFAMAVDLYGNGITASNPEEAGKLAGPFYKNPQLGKSRTAAALAKALSYPQADTSRKAVIGYCFGGNVALNSAKLGLPVNGVVSFHGGFAGPAPVKNLLKARILVCHGAADSFIKPEEIATFKRQLDSLGISYIFKEYADATHAFSNPDATETGKKFKMNISYNAAADAASWNDMKTFFGEIFAGH